MLPNAAENRPEPPQIATSAALPVDGCFAVSARAYRAAICAHEFGLEEWRVLDWVLRLSLDLGRFVALIPTQKLLAEICGMSESAIVDPVKRLRDASVLDVAPLEVVAGGRRVRWAAYSLNPPGTWSATVTLRRPESERVKDLISWLEALDNNQPELLPPPQSLDEALREQFVEARTRGSSASRVEMGTAVSNPPPSSSLSASKSVESGAVVETSLIVKSVNVESVEPGPRATSPIVKSGPAVGGPIRARRIDPIESTRKSVRTDLRIDRSIEGSEEDRRYAEQELYDLVGWHERTGPSGRFFDRCIAEMPNTVAEVVSFVRGEHQLGRLHSVNAYVNRSLRNAMEARTRA